MAIFQHYPWKGLIKYFIYQGAATGPRCSTDNVLHNYENTNHFQAFWKNFDIHYTEFCIKIRIFFKLKRIFIRTVFSRVIFSPSENLDLATARSGGRIFVFDFVLIMSRDSPTFCSSFIRAIEFIGKCALFLFLSFETT